MPVWCRGRTVFGREWWLPINGAATGIAEIQVVGNCGSKTKINSHHSDARSGSRQSRPVPGIVGQKVGIKQVSDKIWLVTFMQYDLGYFDHQTCRLEPIENCLV